MMPEKNTSQKPARLTGAESQPSAKEKREFDAEFDSLLSAVRLAPNKLVRGAPGEAGAEQASQPLTVQPPQPEIVSRLVNFIKKI